jgi:hypothetical protein
MSQEGAEKDAQAERRRILAEERKRDLEKAKAEAKKIKKQGNAP